jgi:hypothetical protein
MFPHVVLLEHCKRGDAAARQLMVATTDALFPQGVDTPAGTAEANRAACAMALEALPDVKHLREHAGGIVTFTRDQAAAANAIVHAQRAEGRAVLDVQAAGVTSEALEAHVRGGGAVRVGDRTYWAGLELQCVEGCALGGKRLYVRRRYVIEGLDATGPWLRDTSEPKATAVCIRWATAARRFDYGHAETGSSLQGARWRGRCLSWAATTTTPRPTGCWWR